MKNTFKLKELLAVLEDYAPLSLSYQMIERGDYDNSGLLIECNEKAERVLFSLDLSNESVKKAIELNCNAIVTHHPAIYKGVKSLSVNGQTKPVIDAVKNNINVISMHLNLDTTEKGIDELLSNGLGGKNPKILDPLSDKCGYGRQADILPLSVSEFKDEISKTFGTDKVIAYGDGEVKKIASFCGGGASLALDAVASGKTDADTIITSDIAHHELKELIELGKNVVILPHYVSEEYGFNKFYLDIKEKLNGKAEVYYFLDKRFI
ncbi:MAG: Nif3-like dinuclear metal center hexameric protein [Clostridia bacterium]|nr:Nif3-like dinuclear metal center hexameric protein [Clostridia bacterium]